MNKLHLAFDRSARRIDEDGRMHLDRSHISKAVINPYYGSEIPGHESLGLQPDKIYKLLRDPAELEKAAPTFARLPILSKHQPVTVDSHAPDLVVGVIGSDVKFNSPYLDADLCFWDQSAIAGIESGQVKELSCGYRYTPDMTPGEFEGNTYDGRMTNIRGNHLALVEVGRAGPDVVVADHNPFSEAPAMKMSKLGKALFAALSAASPKLAEDSALPALVGQANGKTFDKNGVKAKLLGLDATLNPQQLDNIIDALLDVEQNPQPQEMPPAAAADQSPAEQIRALLSGKVDDDVIEKILAMVAAPAEDGCDSDKAGVSVQAMDSAISKARAEMRAEMLETQKALSEVRPVVGDVMGMDSADAVYRFALDHMKVDHAGVEGARALRAVFIAAQRAAYLAPQQIAQDSGGAVEMFPALSRFKNA